MTMPAPWTLLGLFRHAGSLAACFFLAGVCLSISACSSGGGLCILGYQTDGQFAEFRTIRVPVFHNRSFARDIEMQLTEAVCKEIERRTRWKVVQNGTADTELTGTIVSLSKRILLQNPINEVRDAEYTLGVEVVWRDLRTGQVLSNPAAPAGPALLEGPPPLVLPDPIDAPPPPPAVPVLVRQSANFIPELGESPATARKKVVDDLARQIVNLMELPW